MILFCRTETIFYQITSILFSAFPHTKCYSLDPNKVIKHSAFFYFAKFRKFRCCKCFPKNLKSFYRTEGSYIGCLSLIKRLLSIFFWYLIGDILLETVQGSLFKKCFHVVWSQHTFRLTIPSDKDSLGVGCSS